MRSRLVTGSALHVLVAAALPRQLWHAGSVPQAASSRSVYLLRGVLHDWNDEECMKILRHIRAAIGAVPPVHPC